MMRYLKYNVVNKFSNYLPDLNDFELVHEKLPILSPGQFLVAAEYISVDPYIRSFAHQHKVPYEQFGFQVGPVIDSKNPDYPTGMYVVSHSWWRDYTILNGEGDAIFGIKPYEANVGNLPMSQAIGALGMTGMTAYLGLLDICRPKVGDVVCVTSAAGAVGTIVGQIAKLRGCVVIGFAGTDEKIRMLKEELGFDYAFNYKTETYIQGCIRSTVKGIDCFFDNVGGELAIEILSCMNEKGRVAKCGSISTYGDKKKPKEMPEYALPPSVRITPFSFTQWDWTRQKAASLQIREWVQKGDIKVKETIVNGFESLPDMLIAMLKGNNVGKSVVKV